VPKFMESKPFRCRVLRRPIVTLVGKPMILISTKVRTVYIHELPDKTTASPRRRRADPITTSGMTNRRVEARASAQQLELATIKPHTHYLIRFLRNPLPPSTVLYIGIRYSVSSEFAGGGWVVKYIEC
jgi:hypothetical protein